MARSGIARFVTAVMVVIVCLLNSVASAMAGEAIRLRVLSYNIHHAEGVDGILDVPRIAKVILAAEPDIVSLQEVDQNVVRTMSVDQPQELARLTGMQVAFGGNIDLQGGKYGNAVLSRFPILRSRNHLLPNLDQGEQRGVLETELVVKENQSLIFLATHLDHRRDPKERVASAVRINELIGDRLPQPALLAGDLNDQPDSQTLMTLKQQWQPTNPGSLPTIPVGKPARQIDFILLRPQARWKILETKVLDEAVASDHRAILSVIELLPD